MNDPLRAIILGIVEGLTEFLPISSTGHMVLAEPLLGIKEGDPFWSKSFDIFIQVGAIFAVLLYFWRRLFRLTMATGPAQLDGPGAGASPPGPPPPVWKPTPKAFAGTAGHAVSPASGSAATLPYASETRSAAGLSGVELALLGMLGRFLPAELVRKLPAWWNHILVKLFIAFLPAAVIGKLAADFIETHLKNPPVVAGALIVGGIAIILIEMYARRPIYDDAGRIPLRVAFLIGVAQCLALIPGTSRSAATIMGALVLGLSAPAAAEFSFFLAIPTMFAAGGYSLLKHRHDIHSNQVLLLGLGFSVSFVVALLVVAAFMRFIQTHKFTSFAIYRIILGLVVLGWIWRMRG